MPGFAPPLYDAFAALRLNQFLTSDDLAPLENWEFLGHFRVGEGYGFTSILQLESDPTRTRALEVDLAECPTDAATAILNAIGLPLAYGKPARDRVSVLGPPIDRRSCVSDRVTEKFLIGDPPYHVTCTCRYDSGLTYVAMHTPLPSPEM